jgi:predicted HTH transcriptional regulator
MPSTTNVLDEARALLSKRLSELDDERKQLERALLQLGGGVTARRNLAPPTRRAKRRPPGRRRKGGRPAQTLRLVAKTPGISASEIAKAMKIAPNYVYRLLGELVKEGRVKKEGRRYFAAE